MSTSECPGIITGKSLMLNWDPNMDSPLDLVISLGHRSPGFTVRLLVIDVFLSFSLSEDPVINNFFLSDLHYNLLLHHHQFERGTEVQGFLFQLSQNSHLCNALIHRAVCSSSYN